MRDSPPLPRGRVLIVDDDDAIRRLVTMTLSVEGFEVAGAADGADALRLLREDARAADPDLILLDLSMPVMSGATFAREYRHTGGTAPLLLLTATGGAEAAATTEQAQAAAFLVKPFDLRDLVETVRTHMRRRHGGDTPRPPE